MRKLSWLDKVLVEADQALRTVYATAPTTERPDPAATLTDTALLNAEERKQIGRLMRINHTGEISAQGLYRGQALTAKRDDIRDQMERAAQEENDHLNWTAKRLAVLDTHQSVLNPVFYWGSFTIGAVAGKIGDQWSLGFVKETEDQVIRHLDEHLTQIPCYAQQDRAVLQQMKIDEAHHGELAQRSGGARLPWAIRKLVMPLMSKVMTKSTYYI